MDTNVASHKGLIRVGLDRAYRLVVTAVSFTPVHLFVCYAAPRTTQILNPAKTPTAARSTIVDAPVPEIALFLWLEVVCRPLECEECEECEALREGNEGFFDLSSGSLGGLLGVDGLFGVGELSGTFLITRNPPGDPVMAEASANSWFIRHCRSRSMEVKCYEFFCSVIGDLCSHRLCSVGLIGTRLARK